MSIEVIRFKGVDYHVDHITVPGILAKLEESNITIDSVKDLSKPELWKKFAILVQSDPSLREHNSTYNLNFYSINSIKFY